MIQEECKILNILTGSYIKDANGDDWIFDSYIAATQYIDFVLSVFPEKYCKNQFEIICVSYSPGFDLSKSIIYEATQHIAEELDRQMINDILKYTDIYNI